METTIDSVSVEIQSNSSKAIDAIDRLSNSLKKIRAAAKNATTDLKTFNDTLKNMQNIFNNSSISDNKINKVSKTLKGFERISTSLKGNSIISQNTTKKLDLQKELPTIEKYGKLITKTTRNGEVQSKTYLKVANGIKTVTTITGRAITQTQKYTKEQSKLSKALEMIKPAGVLGILTGIYSRIMPKVQESAEFISNWNLFNTVMGESQERAEKFVNTFSNGLGIDDSDVRKYISNFKSLTDSFGMTGEASYIMSKNLTQLSYDLAAFKGISVDDAMQKLKSGIAGEIEPMRAIGIALDEASLQEVAYANGIKQRVSTMTRAQKTELLYYQIMHRTTQAQGYFGKTLITPQTALITIRAEFTKLGRAIGNIFIPILMAAIPYVKAITQVLTEAAQAIAAFFGFELKDFAISGSTFENISGGIEDIGDSAGNATKELKGMLAPFDELNTIDFDKGGGSGAGSAGIGGSLGLPLYDYDALNGALDKTREKVEKIKQFFYDIKDYVLAIGAAFAAWKIGKSVLDFLNMIGVISDKELPSSLKKLVGIGTAIGGIVLAIQGLIEYLKDPSLKNFGKTIQGIGIAVIGLGISFLGLPGIIAGAIILIVGTIVKYWNTIKTFFQEGIDWLKNKSDWIHEVFGNVIGSIYDFLIETLQNGLNFFDAMFTSIKGQFDGIIEFIEGVFAGDWEKAWDGIKKGFSAWWEGIKKMLKSGTIDMGKAVGNLIANSLKTVVNAILRSIENQLNKPIDAINSLIGVINQVPGINLGRLGRISLPRLDVGTNYVPKDQVAMIHKGEAIIPKKFNSKKFFGNTNEETNKLLQQWVMAIGNKNTISNQDQMTDVLRQASYEGVSRAIRENPQSNKTDVYIGNEKIYDSYTRYTNNQSNKYGTNVIRV